MAIPRRPSFRRVQANGAHGIGREGGNQSRFVRTLRPGLPMLRRIERALRSRLARSWLGKIAREAVTVHPYIFGPEDRLTIGRDAVVGDALLNTIGGTIILEEGAFFGHGVSLLTGTHDTSKQGIERQAATPVEGRNILIETGAWLASNVTVVGPCRIGAHAVVCAGAVVTRDVAPGAIVAGVPAEPISSVPAT